ncbi:hypothetical protein BDV96DRAFT_587980 [Lophiotrema nucula]|uniref:Pentatricopeptide repeat protein-like protein n=1 Tax=Lophiotrema nucula TaxID=690887 RepID=A0A6A5YMA6_9PLEO|nr:hypothetical protein BDV96DRAFT_587980 [Lophiotrema nucula]
MSLLRTLDRTTCTSAGSTIAARPLFTFLCSALSDTESRRSFHKASVARAPRLPAPSADQMETLIVQALARAGSCREHAKQMSTLRGIVPPSTKEYQLRRKGTHDSDSRGFKSQARRMGPFKRARKFAEGELKALVDYYGIDIEGGKTDERIEDEGPLIWNVGDDHQPWPVKEEIHKEHIERLAKLLENEKSPHEQVFDCYKRLPSPGVVYLRQNTIRLLLHRLSVVERADRFSMQRFLSILDDMKDAHIHIRKTEWTSAIYFAGRFAGRVTTDELQAALHIWRDMENRAGVKGGVVTLNVLFDVAVKAGKWTLADMFLKELEARGLKIHRHFRVSMLYYHGVRKSGDDVRRAYQELVEAGEIVDTVVMNAVIAALIRAGEPQAAEHVFERMKKLHASKANPKPIPGNWRERRLQGLHLTWEARRIDQDPERKRELQDTAPILPDSRTYALLIRHHSATAGNIDRVTELLQEMQYNGVPIDGTIFIVILYGFCTFGGVRYSSWTSDKLERVWNEYLDSVEQKVQRTWMSRSAAVAGLKAFRKTTDADRTLKAWDEIREVWKPSPGEEEYILSVLRNLVPNHDFFTGNV